MRYVLFLIATVAAAQSWRPAPVTLKTTWGEKVTPENAWREYPRPQFVRSRWQNLNGLWDYTITPQTAATPARYDGQMLVPYPVESSLSGAGRIVSPDQRLWQRRTFTIPAAWRGERILLHFGAVDYECVI